MNAINHTEAQAIHATASATSAVLLEVTAPSHPPLRWYVSLTGRRLPRMDYRDL